jgi:hypothetical protein
MCRWKWKNNKNGYVNNVKGVDMNFIRGMTIDHADVGSDSDEQL